MFSNRSFLGDFQVGEGDAERQVYAYNYMPVAVEGIITRTSDGKRMAVPVTIGGKTLFSIDSQLVLPRSIYGQTAPRGEYRFPAEDADYRVSYSPTGDLAIGYDMYQFATEFIQTFVGTLPGTELSKINPYALLALGTSQSAKSLSGAIKNRDLASIYSGISGLVKSAEFAHALSAGGKGALRAYLEKPKSLLGRIGLLVTGKKFVFDNVLRFAVLADVWHQEVVHGTQVWKVNVNLYDVNSQPGPISPEDMKALSGWKDPIYLTVRNSRIFGVWAAAIIDNNFPDLPDVPGHPIGCVCVFKWEGSSWILFRVMSFQGPVSDLRTQGVPEQVVRWLETSETWRQ